FTFNAIIAYAVQSAARRLGSSVPQHLAVIGFDGLQFGALVEPPLSSVALDTRKLGALAIDQVARLLTGVDPLGADDLIVRAELRLGGSA
ncbi:substrate-binding domain-containing protein, partial [Streptomyces sp. NPDC058272]|uniref:substrate-binding domain-containing protein n=1 Tax=Streptomyces sp. NPDC058272 TaxID=3346415 RepID=UPI0036EC9AC2